MSESVRSENVWKPVCGKGAVCGNVAVGAVAVADAGAGAGVGEGGGAGAGAAEVWYFSVCVKCTAVPFVPATVVFVSLKL